MLHAVQRLLWDMPRRAVVKWLADDAQLLAAAMAYYFAIALFPLLLVLVAVVGFVLEKTEYGQNAEQEVIEVVASQVSPVVGEQLEKLLSTVRGQAATSGPLGGAMFLAAVIAVFAQFERAFGVIWGVPRSNQGHGILATIGHVLFRRLKAFLMLLGVWALVMVTFIASLVWSGVDRYAADAAPLVSDVSNWLQQGASLSINIVAFMFVYRFVPKPRIAWRDALAGGVLAGLGWEIGRQALGAVVVGQRYASAFGVIGSFLAVMLWCYYGAAVLFLGAEYVQVLGAEREKDASEK